MITDLLQYILHWQPENLTSVQMVQILEIKLLQPVLFGAIISPIKMEQKLRNQYKKGDFYKLPIKI